MEDRTTEQQVLFGITTPRHHVTYPELLRVWQAADELGFDSAWLFDHFLPIAGDVEGYKSVLAKARDRQTADVYQ